MMAARAVLPLTKSSISLGNTGTTIPSASMSKTRVRKINASAARRLAGAAGSELFCMMAGAFGLGGSTAAGFRPRGLSRAFPGRERHSIAVVQNRSDLAPISIGIKPDADPSFGAQVWRLEEFSCIGVDQDLL